MADPVPMPADDMLILAAFGLGKVDQWGARGATLVSRDEIEAMALLLAALGLPVLRADMPRAELARRAPALAAFFNTRFNTPLKGPDHDL